MRLNNKRNADKIEKQRKNFPSNLKNNFAFHLSGRKIKQMVIIEWNTMFRVYSNF